MELYLTLIRFFLHVSNSFFQKLSRELNLTILIFWLLKVQVHAELMFK